MLKKLLALFKATILKKTLFLAGLLCFSLFSNAQICTGSLGDPVINETFGSGTSPGIGPSLPGGQTNYIYKGSNCPDNGSYTIATQTSGSALGCFTNSWHVINQDHTGNPNGYMMIVNASVDPGIFYTQKASGNDLCPNTTYEFAAWILNLINKPTGFIKPNITFSIETTTGEVLKSFDTGSIDAGTVAQWKQYGTFFKTPLNGGDIIVKMINNAPGGTGNDLALDDITFRACGPTVQAGFSSITETSAKILCEGSSTFTLEGNIGAGFNKAAYLWQEKLNDQGWKDLPGDTSVNLQVILSNVITGTYQFRLAGAEITAISSLNCRIYSNPLSIFVGLPSFKLTVVNPTVCGVNDGSIKLNGLNNGTEYFINYEKDGIAQKTVLQTAANSQIILNGLPPGKYTNIIASVASGCSSTPANTILKLNDFFFPNVLTPNGDGKNDLFSIPCLEKYPGSFLDIYNRWGSQVYHSINYLNTWNGGDLNTGTYYYVLKIRLGDGSIDNHKGYIQLMR